MTKRGKEWIKGTEIKWAEMKCIVTGSEAERDGQSEEGRSELSADRPRPFGCPRTFGKAGVCLASTANWFSTPWHLGDGLTRSGQLMLGKNRDVGAERGGGMWI
ncbi:unnamed protein product [Boreogadus saida]